MTFVMELRIARPHLAAVISHETYPTLESCLVTESELIIMYTG